MRHYPRNIGDLAAATRGLDLLHRGAYDALLDAYYLREAPLPLDRRECYLLADARSPSERKAVDAVLERFFGRDEDGYHQRRCDREIAWYNAKSAKARASAGTRWTHTERNADAMRTHSERNANALQESCEGNANQEPRTKNQEPRTKEPTPPLPSGSGTPLSSAEPPTAPSEGEKPPEIRPPANPPKSKPPPNPQKTREAHGTRLPADWVLPDEWAAFALQERPDWDEAQVLRTGLEFRDYWHSQAGQRARKADWGATWRNWVRREPAATAPPVNGRGRRGSDGAWWASEAGTIAKATEVGLTARQAESWDEFRRRIKVALGAAH